MIKRSKPLRFSALDLLSKLLTFDPKDRLTVDEALNHPWLAPFQNLEEFSEPPTVFDKWRSIEEMDTTEQFRDALYSEVMEFREEVRNLGLDGVSNASDYEDALDGFAPEPPSNGTAIPEIPPANPSNVEAVPFPTSEAEYADEDAPGAIPSASSLSRFAKDPYRTYSTTRRTSIFSIADRSAGPSTAMVPEEGSLDRTYPSFTSRSRIQSSDTLGGSVAAAPPRFFRQLSTVSISGIADANRANGIVGATEAAANTLARAADAPASELPSEWGRKDGADRSAGGSS